LDEETIPLRLGIIRILNYLLANGGVSAEEQALTLVIGRIVLEQKSVVISTFRIVCKDAFLKVLGVVGAILKFPRHLVHFDRVPGSAFIVEPADHSFYGVSNLINQGLYE